MPALQLVALQDCYRGTYINRFLDTDTAKHLGALLTSGRCLLSLCKLMTE